MKLYGRAPSPFVRHCRVALLECGIDYELVETDNEASARLSPAQKVPFLQDGELVLTDSMAILMHLRAKQGQPLFASLQDCELFCLVNTVAEATINLFFMEKDGLGPEQSAYLTRQQRRIATGLSAITAYELPTELPQTARPMQESLLRLACYLSWTQFRGRVDLAPYPKLQSFLHMVEQYAPFVQTQPA